MSMRYRLAVLGLAFALAPPAPAGADTPAGDDRRQVAEGARVYAENCASCHGVDLEGQPDWRRRTPDGRLPAPPHDATGHTWHHDDDTLFGITKLGTAEFTGLPLESDMRGFKDVLSDDEIRAVLAFIKSRWPARIRRIQAEIDRRAAGR